MIAPSSASSNFARLLLRTRLGALQASFLGRAAVVSAAIRTNSQNNTRSYIFGRDNSNSTPLLEVRVLFLKLPCCAIRHQVSTCSLLANDKDSYALPAASLHRKYQKSTMPKHSCRVRVNELQVFLQGDEEAGMSGKVKGPTNFTGIKRAALASSRHASSSGNLLNKLHHTASALAEAKAGSSRIDINDIIAQPNGGRTKVSRLR